MRIAYTMKLRPGMRDAYIESHRSVWPELVAGGIGLLAAGAISSRFTPRPWWYAGARQLLFGAAAAGITYLVGSAIGVTV